MNVLRVKGISMIAAETRQNPDTMKDMGWYNPYP